MAKNQKQEINNLKEKLKEQKKENISIKKKLEETAKKFRKETKTQITAALIAAFGLIIALVWKDTIQIYTNSIINTVGVEGSERLISLYTSILTTFLAVIGILAMNRWAKKQDTK